MRNYFESGDKRNSQRIRRWVPQAQTFAPLYKIDKGASTIQPKILPFRTD